MANRKFVKANLALAAAAVAVVAAGCGGARTVTGATATVAAKPIPRSVKRAVFNFNTGFAPSLAVVMADGALLDCSVAPSKFPPETTVTVIAASGPYFQRSYFGNGDEDPAAAIEGANYRLALAQAGFTWNQVKRAYGYECRIDQALGEIDVRRRART